MQYKSLFILGRQPAIGRAELESVLGAAHVQPVGDVAMASDIAPADIVFSRLGSAVRMAEVLETSSLARWSDINRHILKALPGYIDLLPKEGKIKLGLSVYGVSVQPKQLFAAGLELKKACKQAGRSARVVPTAADTTELSSAQVLHNQLTSDLGMELLVVQQGALAVIARTVAVQDITAYAARDQNRPKRDAYVGMLPPKLAQTIVNLATGPLPVSPETIVLDPFCGTGVVLQEALLMGYGAYGTDLEPRMVDYSRQNLEWLSTQAAHAAPSPLLEVGDATNHTWSKPFTTVACETYLGHPLAAWPGSEKLAPIIRACNTIIEKFLLNLADQLPTGARLCLAVPAWKAPNGQFHHLTLLDHLGQIGYNQISFEYAKSNDLLYARPDQFVARELLVITRK